VDRTARRCVSILAAATALLWPARPQAAGERSYWRYDDANGVIHITNVRDDRRGWRLYKSLEGSAGGSGGAGRDVRRGSRPVNLGSERLHRWDSHIRDAARRYQLPESLLRAVIHTESNFDSHVVSRAGAMGLTQLMPATARYLGVANPFDPRQSIHGGARFLRILANHFAGDMNLVLAAYNAGPGAVKKYGGVPPYAETRAYVRAVLARYWAYERQVRLGRGTAARGPARHVDG
jgi:soluble lytic murein transglycosylase-like protein